MRGPVLFHCISLFPAGSGKVLAFGWNEHGMCATGDEENVWGPREVSGLPEGGVASLVGAGAGHSLIIHVDGHK